MAKVKYLPARGVRQLGPYTWDVDNDWIAEIPDGDVDTLEDIATYPRPQFDILSGPAPDPAGDPLTRVPGIGKARAAELAEAGVDSVGALAALDDEGIADLATRVGPNRGDLAQWAAAARRIVGA